MLPVETLISLLGSRCCETDRLLDFAWSTFGKVPKGWPLVQAICDFVHEHVTFGYEHAHPGKTACDTLKEGRGAPPDGFQRLVRSLAGPWYTFDARHNVPRIARIPIARGRDATDAAIVTSFGLSTLTGFKVFTDEVPHQDQGVTRALIANT
jgi:transglutaminase-like putative cysteine protease